MEGRRVKKQSTLLWWAKRYTAITVGLAAGVLLVGAAVYGLYGLLDFFAGHGCDEWENNVCTTYKAGWGQPTADLVVFGTLAALVWGGYCVVSVLSE